ncbi:site-specific integrase [Paraburkholderia lacunae]|uniref:site-specific integrase n=1 Tax=Paraburkholderia lacunae TaxID=2211104 RepID=UPI0014023429
MPTYSRIKRGHILGRQWFAKAALEAHADAYVLYLSERGYAAETVQCYLRSVAHFVHWISQRGVGLGDISESAITRYLACHLPRCRCAMPPHKGRRPCRGEALFCHARQGSSTSSAECSRDNCRRTDES